MDTLSLKKLNTHPLNLICIICACIVPLLVTGPFLPDLIISFLSIWFLYFTIKNKIYYIYKNIYFYFFISFWLICILSSLFSDNVPFSLKASFFYVRIGIFSLLIFYLIDHNKKILDYFYYSFVITFGILIIDGFIQFFSGFNIIGLPLRENFRVSSFFGSELILGSYLARLFPLFLALFFIRKEKKFFEIFFFLILFLGVYIMVLISGGRSSFLFMNLAIIFLLIFIYDHKYLKAVLFLIALTITIIIFIKNDRMYNRWFGPFYSSLTAVKSLALKFDGQNHGYIVSAAHDSFLKVSLQMFKEKPILGHGPKMFRVECNKLKLKKIDVICSTHPHNFYVQALAETGFVGFIFLNGLLIYFIYIVLKLTIYRFIFNKKFLSNYQICLLAGLLITIWPLNTNGNIFNNMLMMTYGLQMGFFRKII